MRNGKRVIK